MTVLYSTIFLLLWNHFFKKTVLLSAIILLLSSHTFKMTVEQKLSCCCFLDILYYVILWFCCAQKADGRKEPTDLFNMTKLRDDESKKRRFANQSINQSLATIKVEENLEKIRRINNRPFAAT